MQNNQRTRPIVACCCAVALIAAAVPAKAQEKSTFSSGTGFFVSRQGHIVTNNHVVAHCKNPEEIYFRGEMTPKKATLVKGRSDYDLALLKADYVVDRPAKLRWMHTRIEKFQKVFLLGYPGAESVESPPTRSEATIKDVIGPKGEPNWMQFTDSAAHGNSGGPLLDYTGNVVGVVTAKAEIFEENVMNGTIKKVEESDIAVTSRTLKQFLDANRVTYAQEESMVEYPLTRLQNVAERFVVHIFCEVDPATAEAAE